jgi:hypothetical protein
MGIKVKYFSTLKCRKSENINNNIKKNAHDKAIIQPAKIY